MKRILWGVRTVGIGLILLAAGSSAWAQGPERASGWRPGSLLEAAASTMLFGLIGIVLAIVGFKLFDLAIRFNLESEVCEKNNIAVAIVSGAMVLGICIIIAAAVL
jgi:putative membrane protein